jgi:rhodanese-related sulfurtransferase
MFFGFGTSIESIDTEQVNEKVTQGALVIDIRDPETYKSGHIPKAINIPLAVLRTEVNKLDSAKELLVVCYAGISSKKAVRFLKKAGFDVKNITGGMAAWTGNLER